MSTISRPSAWRWFLRVIFWNPFRSLRPILWACWINCVLQFTPAWNAPWRFYLSMGVILGNVLWLWWFYRWARARDRACETYQREATHWITEMARLQHEIELADEEGASFTRKLELSAQFEEARARFEREQALFAKSHP